MKKQLQIIVLGLMTLYGLQSCTSLTECERIDEHRLFFLVDISDSLLFKEIEADISGNLPNFMGTTRLGSISACERFTLSMVHLSGKAQLDISSTTIAIERRGLSGEEERRLASPKPLIQLLKTKLAAYDLLTANKQITAHTSIGNVLLKCINEADVEAQNTFVIFSDGVENTPLLSLYKGIPKPEDVPQIMAKLAEPGVLEAFRNRQQAGLQAKVIVVLKSEPAGKVDRRAIKTFWISVFKSLGLEVQFIDNLSNHVEL